MTIKPERPDLETWRRNANVYAAPKILWLLEMLEGANTLIEPDAAYLEDWQGDADEWLAKYRGEKDDD